MECKTLFFLNTTLQRKKFPFNDLLLSGSSKECVLETSKGKGVTETYSSPARKLQMDHREWVHSFEMTSNFRISKNLEDRSSNFPNFRKALFQFRILL